VHAAEVLDAAGRIVGPGFIDLHSHADFTILATPQAEGALRQGVTTLVTGNCGMSPFPSASMPDFKTFAEAVTAASPAINVAGQLGHGSLRGGVVGAEARAATDDELRRMCEGIALAAEQGAFGFSTGLIYAPGSFADAGEVKALASEAQRRGLLYSTHMRDEGDELLAAVAEALNTADASGVRLQISHLKAMGPASHGKVHEALALMAAARADSADVAADVYPYTASSTTLTSRLPDWAMDGGPAALLERLADPELRTAIAANLAEREGGTFLPEGTVLAAMPDGPYNRFVGATVRDVADADGVSASEAVLRVLAGHQAQVWIINHAMAEADMRAVLSAPHVAVASDGWELECGTGHPHPRHFGTFARVLGRYVREEGLLTLPDAVHRMSELPASRLGLHDRGVLTAGARADVVVFDAETVADQAT
jgi:N-acyl-D-amino-acid deacylase